MTSDIDASVLVWEVGRSTARPAALFPARWRYLRQGLLSCQAGPWRKPGRILGHSAVHVGGGGASGRAAEVRRLAGAGGDRDVRAGDVAVGGVAGQAFGGAVVAVVGAGGRAAGRRIA